MNESVFYLCNWITGKCGRYQQYFKASYTVKALSHHEQIKERISKSILIGTDETGVKVNGKKDWIWTWQNDELTFITHSDNRGFKTITDNFAYFLYHPKVSANNKDLKSHKKY